MSIYKLDIATNKSLRFMIPNILLIYFYYVSNNSVSYQKLFRDIRRGYMCAFWSYLPSPMLENKTQVQGND